MVNKPTNPKDAVGVRKPPLSPVPAPVLGEIGVALLEGAMKYGRHNYRETGVRASVYYDAAWRHLSAWWEGEDTDPESGLPHLTKAMSSLVVLRDAQMGDMMSDDRPPPRIGWQSDLQGALDALIKRHPEPKPPVVARKTQNLATQNPPTTA